jgi:hypothetical protein
MLGPGSRSTGSLICATAGLRFTLIRTKPRASIVIAWTSGRANRFPSPSTGDTQPGAVNFGLAAGMVVNLEQRVGARGHQTADAGGQEVGNIAGRPAAEVPLDLDSGSRVGRVSGPRFGCIAFPPRAGAVQKRHDVVHDSPVARPVLDGRDVGVTPQVHGDDEAAVKIRTGRRDVKVLGHLEHQVGRSQGPAVGERGRRGAVSLLAARSAGLRPGVEYGDRFPGQPSGSRRAQTKQSRWATRPSG